MVHVNIAFSIGGSISTLSDHFQEVRPSIPSPFTQAFGLLNIVTTRMRSRGVKT